MYSSQNLKVYFQTYLLTQRQPDTYMMPLPAILSLFNSSGPHANSFLYLYRHLTAPHAQMTKSNITISRSPNPHHLPDPVHCPQKPACKDPIQNHRSGNGKDLAPDPEHLSLCLKLNGRGRHRVGKTCNRHQCSCPTPLYDPGIDSKSCEYHGQQHQQQRTPASRCLLVQSQAPCPVP